MQTHEMLEEENDRMVEQMATKVAALKSVRQFVITHLATVARAPSIMHVFPV